jgi:peptidoglycan lytic transglycosylase D
MRETAGVGCGRGVVASLMLGAFSACGGGLPPPPPPVPTPQIELEVVDVQSDDLIESFLARPGPVVHDDILNSPMARVPEFRARVAYWVDFWQSAGARWLPDYLERMSWFSSAVDSALASRGLPPSLRYLPIVESGYSPRAVSRASAAGVWQFMEGTARGYGMRVGPLLDERRNPFKATAAAADFLQVLKDQFGSWFLALAAYNAGPYRVQALLDRYAPLEPRTDSLYWALRRRLPPETRDFVPKFFAAVEVAGHPEAYGIDLPGDSLGFDYDEVVVPDATTMDVVAKAAEAPQTEIMRLNPEVVRGITPPGKRTVLRVPAGQGDTFTQNYAHIPPRERVTFVEHRVARGETLSHIAVRYGVRVSDLTAANPGIRPTRLRIGQRVIVPVAPSARAASRSGSR